MSNLLKRILGRGPVHTPISQEPLAIQQGPPSNLLPSAPWPQQQYLEPPRMAEYMQPMSPPQEDSGPISTNAGPSPTVEPPRVQQYQFASSPLPPQPAPSSYATYPNPSTASSAGAGQQFSTGYIPPKNNARELPAKVPSGVPFKQQTPEIIVSPVDTASLAPVSPIVEVSPYFADPDAPTFAPPVGDNPLISPGLTPPVPNFPMSTPDPSVAITAKKSYDTDKPTCSLNLVCYREGAQGCVLRQIQTVLASRYSDKEAFELATKGNAQLIATDKRFFKDLRRMYSGEMSGMWRRWFSLKTLTGFRLLSYSPETRPVVVPMDEFILQEMFYAYEHPERITSQTDWIEWVFRLRRRDKRHALEFVEGWNSTRVIFAGMLPWLISCIVGVAWTATGRDAQTAFTVASFILTSGTVILALLAVISGIESSGRMHPSAS